MNGVGVDASELRLEAYEVFGTRFPYALVLLDPGLSIVWASPATSLLLDLPRDQIVGTNVLDVVHPDDLAEIIPMAMAIIGQAAEVMWSPAAASNVELPVRVRTSDGGWSPVTVSGRVFDDSGRLLALLRPAVERHALDVVLDGLGRGADLDEVLGSLVDLVKAQFGVDQAWLVHDLDGDTCVIGSSQEPGIGVIDDLLSGVRSLGPSSEVRVDDHRWVVPVLSSTQESLLGVLILPTPRDGGPNPYDAYVLRRTTNLASLAFTRGIDDRRLRRAAATDHLTGVLNRRAFESHLAQTALRPNEFPATLLFVDVDEFKSVNDRHGHRTGDEVLIGVAARLSQACRATDVVGRLGGDEFAVLCAGLTDAEIAAMRRRLDAAFADPFHVQGRQVRVSVSVGLAVAFDEDALEDLVDRSDADMYVQKHGQRA